MFRVYIILVMVICAVIPRGIFASKQKTYHSALEKLVEEEYKQELQEAAQEGQDTDYEELERDAEIDDLRRSLGYGPTSERVELDYEDDDTINGLLDDLSTEVDYE